MIRRAPLRAFAAVVLALVATPALAQSYQCRAPERISVPDIRADGPRRITPITGYTLALSWSPEFCRTAGRRAASLRQCNRRHGWFGLVVHGLWPNGPRGSWPQWCKAGPKPSPQTIARHLCMTPSASLLARQWAKHGSCLTRRPETYFRVTEILWNGLVLPDLDSLSRKDGLTAGDLRAAWAGANPAWSHGAVGVKRNARGWLEEVRLCYGKDWLPEACERGRFGPPDATRLSIWRGL